MGRGQREKGAAVEREVAKALHWKRGRAFSGEPDVEGSLWVGSVKARARFPQWIEDAVTDAQNKALNNGKEPIVILVRRRKGAKPLVLVAHIGLEAWVSDHGLGGGVWNLCPPSRSNRAVRGIVPGIPGAAGGTEGRTPDTAKGGADLSRGVGALDNTLSAAEP